MYLEQFVLAFFVALCHGQCLTKPTAGGTPSPERCIFPFTFRSRRFTSCTRLFDAEGKLWCSVEVDSRGHHVQTRGRWGYCNDACTASQLPPRPIGQQCTTARGPCIFPFRYQGIVFNECSTEFSRNNRPWCATKVDSNQNTVGNNRGYCNCVGSQSSTTLAPAATRPVQSKICSIASKNSVNVATTQGNYLPEETDLSFQCGKKRLKKFSAMQIIGGNDTDLQEFPFAVLLVFQSSGIKRYLCGGSLINRRYVLTAAHCMALSRPIAVLLGEYDRSQACDCLEDLCAPIPQEIPIEQIIVHKQYNARAGHPNDIALLRLSHAAHINPGVSTVCLPLNPTSLPDLDDQTLTAVGWGLSQLDNIGAVLESIQKIGVSTGIIQKVEVPAVDHLTCKRVWRSVTSKQICAGADGVDSCNGDSGGPLLYRSGPNEPWYLAGVVSFGSTKCGNGRPAVYTRVDQYISWIRQNITP